MRKITYLIISIIFLIFINACAGYKPIHTTNLQFKIVDYSIKSNNKYYWPKYNPKLLKKENCTIVVQVDGRKRGIMKIPIDSKEIMVIKKSKDIDNVSKHIGNAAIIKNIYIKNKLVNFITKK